MSVSSFRRHDDAVGKHFARFVDAPDAAKELAELEVAGHVLRIFLDELLDEKEYYEGRVAYQTDGAFLRDAEKESKLLAGFAECHLLLAGSPWAGASEAEQPVLAYHLAAQLPVELEYRQMLLEARSESDRRDMLLRWIGDFLPKLKERQRVQGKASGNGHAYLN